jgi:hypothetical protein
MGNSNVTRVLAEHCKELSTLQYFRMPIRVNKFVLNLYDLDSIAVEDIVNIKKVIRFSQLVIG